MKSRRIAVCLYGQWRTADYCLPWIAKQYEFADVSYFVHTKTYSTYTNTDVGYKDYSARSIENSVTKYLKGVRSLEVICRQDEKFVPKNGHWHYAPMFSSMQRAAYAFFDTPDYESFDWVVLQRLDSLVGPVVGSFGQKFSLHPTTDTLYVMDRNMRFSLEANQRGLHDLLIVGKPHVVNLLVAETFQATANPKHTDWQRFAFEGPNVFLRKCANACGHRVEDLAGLEIALVRPDADLDRFPVFDSFEHHKSFWIKNHKGMK